MSQSDGTPFRAILDGEEVRDLFAGQRPTITVTSAEPGRKILRGKTNFRAMSFAEHEVIDSTPRNVDGVRLTREAVEWINHPERFPAGWYVRTCEAIHSDTGLSDRACRGAFLARRPWAKFCSPACRQWAHHERQRQG